MEAFIRQVLEKMELADRRQAPLHFYALPRSLAKRGHRIAFNVGTGEPVLLSEELAAMGSAFQRDGKWRPLAEFKPAETPLHITVDELVGVTL